MDTGISEHLSISWQCIASSIPLPPPFLPRRLRQIDLEVLKRLHRKVNVVPVIAKADTLTTYEVKMLKDRILADIEEHEIQVVSVVPVIFLRLTNLHAKVKS